jgi:hypothetical protein
VAILGRLKTGFTHHLHSKELLREVLAELGCDLTKTYYDVPKLRIVTPASYLNAGLGYNYTPHRNTLVLPTAVSGELVGADPRRHREQLHGDPPRLLAACDVKHEQGVRRV